MISLFALLAAGLSALVLFFAFLSGQADRFLPASDFTADPRLQASIACTLKDMSRAGPIDDAWYAELESHELADGSLSPVLLERAADGNENAQLMVAFFYLGDLGRPDLYPEGISWLQSAAQAGSPLAANELGRAYSIGDFGLQSDRELAIYWLLRGQERGDRMASYNLAELHRTWTLAAPFSSGPFARDAYFDALLASASNCYPEALHILANELEKGISVTRDSQSAANLRYRVTDHQNRS